VNAGGPGRACDTADAGDSSRTPIRRREVDVVFLAFVYHQRFNLCLDPSNHFVSPARVVALKFGAQ